jgi:hypothetical protein
MPQSEDHLSVADVLRIVVSQRPDAECIADALTEYDAQTKSQDGRWVVLVGSVSDGAMLIAVLDALKSCLDANGIDAVGVAIDDQHYVMEGAGPDTRT